MMMMWMILRKKFHRSNIKIFLKSYFTNNKQGFIMRRLNIFKKKTRWKDNTLFCDFGTSAQINDVTSVIFLHILCADVTLHIYVTFTLVKSLVTIAMFWKRCSSYLLTRLNVFHSNFVTLYLRLCYTIIFFFKNRSVYEFLFYWFNSKFWNICVENKFNYNDINSSTKVKNGCKELLKCYKSSLSWSG